MKYRLDKGDNITILPREAPQHTFGSKKPIESAPTE